MFVLGLTGSIGMGKTTAARMFRRLGVPVHDADAAVHRLFAKGGRAVPLIAARFPEAVVNGAVDRGILGRLVLGTERLTDLEAIVHPLVRDEERRFLSAAAARGHRLAVLDIPLLYETKGDARCNAVVVVTAPARLQQRRVLARPGMSEERLRAILDRQIPDNEKRRRADFILRTDLGRRYTWTLVQAIVHNIMKDAHA